MSIQYYKVSLESVARKLRSVLEALPDVKVAVLYGSVLRRRSVRDVDVGVYLGSAPDLMRVVKIAGVLEDALGVPVDVVPLAEMPPRLRLKALLDGLCIVVRDRNLFTSLLSQALSETLDLELKLSRESPPR